MATRTAYKNIIHELHLRQTHELRKFLKLPKKKSRAIISKNYLEQQISKIQQLVLEENINLLFHEEFLNFISEQMRKNFFR